MSVLGVASEMIEAVVAPAAPETAAAARTNPARETLDDGRTDRTCFVCFVQRAFDEKKRKQ